MKKQVKVSIEMPLSLSELAINASCLYYETTPEELFGKSPHHEHSERKSLIYHLLKTECNMTVPEIARIAGTSRQYVSYMLDRVDIRSRLYLSNACHYENIKHIFTTLHKEQKKWMQDHSQ
jgi:hypothetical protein